jgi:hypothetical protein
LELFPGAPPHLTFCNKKPMKLETAQSLSSDRATVDDIRNALANDKLRGEFIILSTSPQNYIQAAGDSEPFLLEYREGSESEHYECAQDISRADLESALISYLSGDSKWRTQFQWKKLERKPWWKIW